MLTDLLVPTYTQMLRTLAGLLDKAQEPTPEQAEAMLSAKLAPDMFPLASQILFSALQAQEAVFRLRGEAVPKRLDTLAAEARNAGEASVSMARARSAIDEALSFLADLAADALDAGASLPVVIALPGGVTFEMTGEQYARDWALPQFYFHVVTAYAVLRNHGVEIGKADYVPHMFAYLRPAPAPKA